MSPNTQSQLLQIWRSSHLQKRIVHANRQMRKTQWTLKCQGSWQSSPKRLRKLLKNKQISRTHNPFNAPLKPIIRKRDHNKKNPSHLQDPTFGTYACSLRRNSFVDHLVSAVRRVFGPFSTGFAIRNSQLAAETRQIRPPKWWPHQARVLRLIQLPRALNTELLSCNSGRIPWSLATSIFRVNNFN